MYMLFLFKNGDYFGKNVRVNIMVMIDCRFIYLDFFSKFSLFNLFNFRSLGVLECLIE